MPKVSISAKQIIVDGKRVGVTYAAGPWIGNVDPSTIKIRRRVHSFFPAEFRSAFAIENNSDMTTDYFEADCIRIVAGHPLYEQVRVAAAEASS
jgi:hypothetical protein